MKEKQVVAAMPARDAGEVERTSAERYYAPDVDIVETNEEIIVLADVPGADEKCVDVMLENDVLRIEAKIEKRCLGNRCEALAEYGVGSFVRSFLITDDVDRANIEATVRNGTLRVRLPKAQEVRARKITVKND